MNGSFLEVGVGEDSLPRLMKGSHVLEVMSSYDEPIVAEESSRLL